MTRIGQNTGMSKKGINVKKKDNPTALTTDHHILNSDSRRSNPFDSESPVGSSGLSISVFGDKNPKIILQTHAKYLGHHLKREDDVEDVSNVAENGGEFLGLHKVL